MNKADLTSKILLLNGTLLCMIALVHLFDTPLVALWLDNRLTIDTLKTLSPAMLLSQFIGVVIIPFGISTIYSAAGVRMGHRWARMIALTNGFAVIVIPLLLFLLAGFQYSGSYLLLFTDILMVMVGLSIFIMILWL